VPDDFHCVTITTNGAVFAGGFFTNPLVWGRIYVKGLQQPRGWGLLLTRLAEDADLVSRVSALTAGLLFAFNNPVRSLSRLGVLD
jgi:hypothetical protein